MAFDRTHYAGLAWPILTNCAAGRKTLYYGELARPLGIHHRQCRLFLEVIQDYTMNHDLPPLTSLVIGKVTGLPGHGFIAWDIDDAATAQEAAYDFDWSEVPNPFDFANQGESEDSLAHKLLKPQPEWEAVYRLVKTRGVQQSIFRRALITAYNGTCAITDCRSEGLLEAAHILPWSECTPEERLDVRNGLLLTSTYHDLLDLDWVRITPDYRIIPGPKLPPAEQRGRFENWIVDNYVHGRTLRLPRDPRYHPNPEYIRRTYAE